MPIERSVFGMLGLESSFIVSAFFLLFVLFYIVFSLILYRQIQLMGRTLPTNLVGFLKFISILLVGMSLALLIIAVGSLI